MIWDVALILGRYPPQYRFSDKHYVMLPLTDAMVKGLSELSDKHVPGPKFFESTQRDLLTAFSFRCSADSEDEAFEKAQDTIAGFIDGLCLIFDHHLLPKICPLAYVRNEEEKDARIVVVCEPTWAYFNAPDAGVESAWAKRCQGVFDILLPFFDVVAGVHARSHTELARQVQYSLKMYRHGVEAGVYGLEFLCKWSALEGLVCGGTRSGKRRLLLERLPALFPDEKQQVETQVEDLWITRNEAVHEAKAFRSSQLAESSPLAGPIESTDRLFLAVVTFALAHIEAVDSITYLWARVSTYSLPDPAKERRPKQMPRFMVTACRMRTGAVWTDGGRQIDEVFAAIENRS